MVMLRIQNCSAFGSSPVSCLSSLLACDQARGSGLAPLISMLTREAIEDEEATRVLASCSGTRSARSSTRLRVFLLSERFHTFSSVFPPKNPAGLSPVLFCDTNRRYNFS